jgi:hypothetical protein
MAIVSGVSLMEIPQRNAMENSGRQNPKTGFKSPPEQQRRKSGAQQFRDILIDFGAKNLFASATLRWFSSLIIVLPV